MPGIDRPRNGPGRAGSDENPKKTSVSGGLADKVNLVNVLTAVQVGDGWFSENPGGLDRYFHDLLDALPEAGVACRGLVVGSTDVDQETDGVVRAFARPDEPLRKRSKAVQAAVSRAWVTPNGERKVLVTHFALYAPPLAQRPPRPAVGRAFPRPVGR